MYDALVQKGTIVPAADKPVPAMPQDLAAAVAQGKVRAPPPPPPPPPPPLRPRHRPPACCRLPRRIPSMQRGALLCCAVLCPLRPVQVRVPTHIVSTICDDRGEEPTYAGVSMSELIQEDYGVGDVVRSLARAHTHARRHPHAHGHGSPVITRAGSDARACPPLVAPQQHFTWRGGA